MAASSSVASSSTSAPQFRSRFGDTSQIKIFVGGLPWETTSEELHAFFVQFGEILEAVVIADRATGRSKGYGFVTFREPGAARRAVADPNPIIGGRRSNCNIASHGRPYTPAARGRGQGMGLYYGPQQQIRPLYGRLPAQMQPSTPAMYPGYYGYPTYPGDFAYQQALYSPQMSPHYYHYEPTSPSAGTPQPFNYPHIGFTPNPRVGLQVPQFGAQSPYIQQPAAMIDPYFVTPVHSMLQNLQLQTPPNTRQPVNPPAPESHATETQEKGAEGEEA
ncbi:RNA-binding (RRM/RBD/RNP motifs) family protein [Rhynchospora pubera]|uniref:RNA-binding (RRM/RBD/RNP motifs) family protein n=1 Tax=Rhynchospora pubera TaxID=906938 RepID=A0AAV8BRL5_9POAL|nr:RNA-binding (RRM/RBD/RNP motifs) family protein [Rhynchospora pubera]KAJ4799655.1 RNA-binding (RRM/RBD/RNP motifs) family protein [Rhynchospora pubera]